MKQHYYVCDVSILSQVENINYMHVDIDVIYNNIKTTKTLYPFEYTINISRHTNEDKFILIKNLNDEDLSFLTLRGNKIYKFNIKELSREVIHRIEHNYGWH